MRVLCRLAHFLTASGLSDVKKDLTAYVMTMSWMQLLL